jgi:hypothetical protein
MQTSQQAINALMHGENADYVPLHDSPWGDTLKKWVGQGMPTRETGDREKIRTAVTELIEGMKERGARYVYGSDHSLSTEIDYEDFLYSLEVYREHRKY